MKVLRGKMLFKGELHFIPFTWNNGDTTPPIDGGHFFKTGSTAITVTSFTNTPGPGICKEITVIIQVNGFTFQHSGGAFADCTTIWCPGASNKYFKAGDLVDFLWDGTRAILNDPTLSTL